METSRTSRFAPLAGVLFLLIAVAAFALSNDTPSTDDSAAKVADYWRDNDTKEAIASILGALGAAVFVWFGASLREAIARREGGTGRLATLTFAGTVIFAVGLTTNCSIEFATAIAADDVPDEVTQTLSTLYDGFFLPMTTGIALMFAASGLAALRTGFLPRWLGIVQLIAAALLFTPAGFFVFIASIVWVAAISVVLFRRGDTDALPPATGTAAPAASPPPA